MELLVIRSELAKILKLSTRRIDQLVKEGVLKRDDSGKYDLPEAVEAYFKYKLLTDEDVNYQREHTLFEKAKRQKAEIELEQLKGTLIFASEAEQAVATMVLTVKSRILGLPSKCAPLIIGQRDIVKITGILRDEVYQALTELSQTPQESMIDTETFVEDPLRGKMG
jgi:hypothetical protein